MGRFKTALVQIDSGDNVDKNKESIAGYTKKAFEAGAELVIFPEHSDAIGKCERRFATAVPGEMSDFYASLAKEYGIYLHCGSMTELSGADRPYNTSLLFDPDGKQIGAYRKLHMFDVTVENGPDVQESKGTMPGDKISVVNTPLCKIGLSICYDLRFCELYRIMAYKGAQLLIVSANFTENTGKAHWETLVRARAIENACYVAAVNQCGKKYNFTAWGHTMLADPWGKVVGSLGQEEGMIVADIDPENVDRARLQIPVLNNIRTDIYSLSQIN